MPTDNGNPFPPNYAEYDAFRLGRHVYVTQEVWDSVQLFHSHHAMDPMQLGIHAWSHARVPGTGYIRIGGGGWNPIGSCSPWKQMVHAWIRKRDYNREPYGSLPEDKGATEGCTASVAL